MTTAPALRIRLLGAFAASVGERAVPERAWGTRRARQVVALLALAPGQRLVLDQLWDALWPDLAPDAARHACHQALYVARRALDPDRLGLLTVRQGVVALAAPGGVAVDAVAFAAAAEAAARAGTVAAHQAALALYAGELLPDDRYEDWAAAPREEARRRSLTLLLDLARLHEAASDWDAACAAYERALAAEPAHEGAHAGLMRAHARAGRRPHALAQYRLLRAALRRELDAAPEPATERLYAALLAGQPPPEDALPAALAGASTPAPAAPRHNLPAQVTPLFGRAADLAAVRAAVRAERLVTLTGAGGCGKTRLAIAAADGLVGDFAAGVWLADLAPLADGGLVPGTVSRLLDVRDRPGQDTTTTLVAALRDRALLLVLDNCEHLADASAALIAALLVGCPQVRVLATSRAALRAAGEVVWRVPSLPVPDDGAAADEAAALATVAASPAVELFVARARLVRPDLAVTAQTAPALARICRQLDGLPLALELAAARAAVLAPEQLATRLGGALRVLTAGPRTAPARQQTLRATLDWSYQLLDAAGQTLLARLAVFVGGWTLDAAEAVCADTGAAGDVGDVLDGLAALVGQSLVQVEVPPGDAAAVRYRLLETVRQYAAEQLAAIEEADAIRARHARFFLALAEEGATHYRTRAFRTWDRCLTGDLPNLRAALHWCLDTSEAEAGLRLANALYWYWYWHNLFQEGWGWQARLLALPGAAVAAAVRARALASAALLIFYQGEYATTRALATEALDLCATAAIDDPPIATQALIALGHAALGREDFAQAQAHYEEALTLARRSGRPALIGGVLVNLTNTLVYRKDLPQAAQYGEEALGHTRESGDIPNLCYILGELGNIYAKLGQVARAAAMQHEALRLSREFNNWYQVYQGLGRMVDLALQEGRMVLVAQLWGAFCAVERRESFSDLAFFRRTVSAKADQAREQLAAAAFARAEAQGRSWSNDEAVTHSLAFLETLQATPTPSA